MDSPRRAGGMRVSPVERERGRIDGDGRGLVGRDRGAASGWRRLSIGRTRRGRFNGPPGMIHGQRSRHMRGHGYEEHSQLAAEQREQRRANQQTQPPYRRHREQPPFQSIIAWLPGTHRPSRPHRARTTKLTALIDRPTPYLYSFILIADPCLSAYRRTPVMGGLVGIVDLDGAPVDRDLKRTPTAQDRPG